MNNSHKIVVIGLDGATWDLIDPWIKAGRLPVLKQLVSQGTRGVLQSTSPPVSPLAWSSFLTGTNPGKHGIYGFIRRLEGEYRWRTVSASDRSGRPLWNFTDAHGHKSAFLYVPLTFPPSPLNGVMISGLGTPGVESDFIYPAQLKSELSAHFDKRYLVEPFVRSTPEKTLKEILNSIEVQAGVFQHIMSLDNFSLTVFVFGQTDRVQHFYWREMDPSHPDHDPSTPDVLKHAIRTVYERLDAVIGQIYEALDDDTTLILMSDHGFGPYHREVYLNNWLAQLGFLSYKQSHGADAKSSLSQWTHRSLYSAIGLVEGRLPQKIIWPLRKYGFLSRMDQINANPAAAEIDWTRTRVYSADYWGNLYLNLRGREPSGIVEPGQEAEEVLNELVEELNTLRDPESGERIVQQAYLRKELYTGPLVDQAPDLLVEFKRTYHCKPQPLGQHELIVASAGKYKHATLAHTAEHHPEGIVLLTGSKIRKGHSLESANIVDLAPTILYLLNYPLSNAFDGVPLIDAVHPTSRREEVQMGYESPSVLASESPVSGYSNDEAREIEDRLRDLGYL